MADLTDEQIKKLLAIDGFTPGPWDIVAQERCGFRSTEYYHEVWDNDFNAIVEEVTRAHADGGIENIRLIAAAPDLHAALRQTLARALAAEAKVERLRAALADLVDCNERWNTAVQQIIRRPPNWTDNYLNAARAALKETRHD